MALRKILFWLHLIAGITAGIVILIMSVTGVLLTYEKQIVAWVDRDFPEEAPPAGAERLPLQAIVSEASAATNATPTTVTFYANSRTAAVAASGTTIYIDAYSGKLLGSGSPRLREFFRSVTNWHRYLALSGDSRPTGRSLTGASNLIFLFIVVSGLVIWLPRGKWTLQSLRPVTWFRRGLNAKARNFNWHNVFGFWAAVPLFLVVLSGTVISYPWASNLVYRVTGTEPPAPRAEGRASGEAQNRDRGQNAQQATIDVAGIDPFIVHAEQQLPGWKTIALRLPTSGDAPLSFTIDQGRSGQPQFRSTLSVDRKNGNITRLETFADQNLGRRTRSWLRYVHTGEFYGIAGQTIAGLASFAGVMLVWTGFALVWKRFWSWVKLRPRESWDDPAMPQRVHVDSDRG